MSFFGGAGSGGDPDLGQDRHGAEPDEMTDALSRPADGRSLACSGFRAARGQVLIVFATSILLFLLLCAAVVDMSWYWTNNLRMQRAADAAALAGVVFLPGDPATAVTVARAEAAKNGYVNGTGGVTVTPAQDPSNLRRLNVTITGPIGTYFARTVGITSWPARRVATADYVLPGADGQSGPVLRRRLPDQAGHHDDDLDEHVQRQLRVHAGDDDPRYAGLDGQQRHARQLAQQQQQHLRPDLDQQLRPVLGDLRAHVGPGRQPGGLRGPGDPGPAVRWLRVGDLREQQDPDLAVVGQRPDLDDAAAGADGASRPARRSTTSPSAARRRTSAWAGHSWVPADLADNKFVVRTTAVKGCATAGTTINLDMLEVQVNYQITTTTTTTTTTLQPTAVTSPSGGALTPQNFWASMQSQGSISSQGDAFMTKYETRIAGGGTGNLNATGGSDPDARYDPSTYYNYIVEIPSRLVERHGMDLRPGLLRRHEHRRRPASTGTSTRRGRATRAATSAGSRSARSMTC